MTERVASAQNGRVKLAAALKQKKHRDATGLFVAEGVRLAEEAARSGWEIAFALCTEAALQNARAAALVSRLERQETPVCVTDETVYAKAGDTRTPQGLLLVVRQRFQTLEMLLRSGETPLLTALDRVQDPGNVGAIIRTADAAGCSGVILLEDTADPYAPKAVRASMGSLFHLPVVAAVVAAQWRRFAQEHSLAVWAAALDPAAQSCFAVDLTRATALIFGNEGGGVRAELLEDGGGKLFIPMSGRAESLNVAAAAAVILYEGFRQRHA